MSKSMIERKKKYLQLKRILDVLLSGAALILLSPLFLGLAIVIKLDSSGPVFFKQMRIGKNKELFKIWKFRKTVQAIPPQYTYSYVSRIKTVYNKDRTFYAEDIIR